MADRTTHTIGAEIAGLRVPQAHFDDIQKIETLLDSGADKKVVLGELAGMLAAATSTSAGDTEFHDGGVLNTDRANFEKRFQPDLHKVRTICSAMRDLGHKIVLTSGTFDIIHIGHAQYLEAASRYGDFLVVGVDSDEKVRAKKGDNRPIVNEDERLKMLAHLRCVDLLTVKKSDDAKWQLISIVQPDTLIATEGTYTEDQVKTLESGYVERVVVLPPQATTSTTARLRRMQIGQSGVLRERVNSALTNELTGELDARRLQEIRALIDSIFGDD